MKFAKKQPEPQQTLLERIEAIRAEVEDLIESRTAELKASQAARSLPIGYLRQEITKADHCHCRVARRLLGES